MSLRSVTHPQSNLSRSLGFGVAVLAFAVCAVFFFAPQTHAAFGAGGSTSSGGGAGHWTWHGFGWKLFPKSGSGPNDGFRNGTAWASVQTACRDYSGTGVWVHVVRNAAGRERSYNYEGSWYNVNRPAAGGDPWVYNAAGNYQYMGAAGSQTVINIVASVQQRFAVEHSGYMSHWGNDVAWFCDGPKVVDWNLRGESYLKSSTAGNATRYQGAGALTATPGQTVYWDHDLRNTGPANMPANVTINVKRNDYAIAGGGLVSSTNNPANVAARGTVNQLFFVRNNLSRTITQADVGNRLCQRLEWTRGSSSNAGMMHSNTLALSNLRGARDWTCVSVPYNYTLIPTISVSGASNGAGAVGTRLTPEPNVEKTGPTKSENAQWQVNCFTLTPGTAIPRASGGMSPLATAPSTYYATSSNVRSCAAVPVSSSLTLVRSGTRVFDVAQTNASNYASFAIGAQTVSDYPVGTRVCYALSVQPYTHSGSNWRHSAPQCVTISKSPNVQVLGGDLFVGRTTASNSGRDSQVDTSTTTVGGRTYGSWAEYAIVPSGAIFGMASGSGYSGGATTTTVDLLSFTQNTTATGTCAAGSTGCYTHGTSAPDIAARFPTASAQPLAGASANVSNMSGVYYRTSTAALTITSSADIGQLPSGSGRWVVINAPNATVTIRSNIEYTDSPLTSVAQIPQVVIIARNILIAENQNSGTPLTRVDAWLIATGSGVDAGDRLHGRINTCLIGSNEATLPTANSCNDQLVVNGPISANQLLLRRTAGADAGTAAGDPAEVFNLRADAYIWATSYTPGTGRLPTATVSELPPRF